MDHSSIAQTENQTALATQNGNIYYFPTKDIDGIADIDAALQKNQNQIDTLSLRFLREQIEADTIGEHPTLMELFDNPEPLFP